MENHPVSPQFELPQPGRLRKVAMKAAGLLLKETSPEGTLERLATDVGGYDSTEVEGRKVFRADVDMVAAPTLQDETTKSRYELKYRSGMDYGDATGLDLRSAATRTVAGHRKGGKLAGSVKGRAARRLTRYATKGVGVDGFIKN